METWTIKGKELEYIDESHTYIYDGVILPSITQMMKIKFGNKYKNVDQTVLNKASEKGTAVHKAIEEYEQQGKGSEYVELRNYMFLKKAYNFECIDNEVSVVLFQDDEPIACGRLDLVLAENGELGLGDIKRTATLDKNYLAYQLNLYRIAYQQCYNAEITFLRGLHLRDNTRRYITLPINETLALELINEYKERQNNEKNGYC